MTKLGKAVVDSSAAGLCGANAEIPIRQARSSFLTSTTTSTIALFFVVNVVWDLVFDLGTSALLLW